MVRFWRLHLPEGETMTVSGPDFGATIKLKGYDPDNFDYDAAVELKREEVMRGDPNVPIMDVLAVTKGEIAQDWAVRNLKHIKANMRNRNAPCESVADFLDNVTNADVPGNKVKMWINWVASQFQREGPFMGY